jgi:hypothetical protein
MAPDGRASSESYPWVPKTPVPDSTLSFPSSRILPSPYELHTTLSSWLKNLNNYRASSTADRLEELASASSTPAENRSQLSRQVATLRATLNSTKIRQSSSSLDMLQKCLDMAKTLPRQAVDLRKSHESGTAGTVQVDAITGPGVRETGKTSSFYLQRQRLRL